MTVWCKDENNQKYLLIIANKGTDSMRRGHETPIQALKQRYLNYLATTLFKLTWNTASKKKTTSYTMTTIETGFKYLLTS